MYAKNNNEKVKRQECSILMHVAHRFPNWGWKLMLVSLLTFKGFTYYIYTVCIYLRFGFSPPSIKYLTAPNEPHEEAWRNKVTTLSGHSVISSRCHCGAVACFPPSTRDWNVFSMLVT